MSICCAFAVIMSWVVITLLFGNLIVWYCKNSTSSLLHVKLYLSGFVLVALSATIYIALKAIIAGTDDVASSVQYDGIAQLFLISWGAMGGGLMSAGILKNLDVNDTAKANNLKIE